MSDQFLRPSERYGVQACVYRIGGIYTYRWLGSSAWHYGDVYDTAEDAAIGARDVLGRLGFEVEVVFG